MAVLIIILLSVLIAGWIFLSVFGSFGAKGFSGWKLGPSLLARALLILGAVGFFGNGLSAAGGLNWLPPSFEWPAGYSRGVLTTPAGVHVVPLQPSGRVQIYDAGWKFLRGWHIEGSGKPLDLTPAGGETFHVFTAGSHWDFVFDTQGRMISKEKYGATSGPNFRNDGEAMFVPTRLWLWVFSSPFLSFFTMMAGMGLIMLIARHAPKDVESSPPTR
jgi:hypothetical protein